MSETPGLDELRKLARKLRNLLIDAHPGIPEWRMEVNRVLKQLDQYSADPDPRYTSLVESPPMPNCACGDTHHACACTLDRLKALEDFARDFLRWAEEERPYPTRMALEARATALLKEGADDEAEK